MEKILFVFNFKDSKNWVEFMIGVPKVALSPPKAYFPSVLSSRLFV